MAHQREDAVHVAEMFGQVARVLAAHDDERTTLHQIVHLAVENLDACEYAGITLVEEGRFSSPASSNDVPRTVDAIQSETGEGPCVDAIIEQAVFQTGDLCSEQRWPQFSRRAYDETSVRSIVAFRLFVEHDTMGALNLYSAARDAFDEYDIALGSVFAVHAAVAMQSSQREAQLEVKAETRDVIGQAKGILMARSGVDDERAFQLLKAASQRSNVKLREIAERIARGERLSGTS